MLQHLVAHLLHDLGTRVIRLVHTVPKAHQPMHENMIRLSMCVSVGQHGHVRIWDMHSEARGRAPDSTGMHGYHEQQHSLQNLCPQAHDLQSMAGHCIQVVAIAEVYHHSQLHRATMASAALPEGIILVLGPLDGFRDLVPAANVLQHAQHSLIGTPMGGAPQRCNA